MTDSKTKKAETPDEQPTRYAAYNGTYLRFFGRVQDTKKAVTDSEAYKAAKDAGDDVEVREV